MNNLSPTSASSDGDIPAKEVTPQEASTEISSASLPSQESGLEQRLHRHRSSRRDEREKSNTSNSSARKHSKGRNKRSPGEIINQWIMWGCFFFGAIAFLAIGFYCGQKFGTHPEVSNCVIHQDAPLPTAETETLLDSAFTAYQDGKYRAAMMDFQKAQDAQPALFGIDYLIAESAIKAGEQALAQEDDAKAFGNFADLLRMTGEYRSAVEILHKGVIRANPDAAKELLSAKEQLARLQNEQARTVPSLSELTSMTGEQALVAALAALQLKQSEEAAVFLERARDLYPPQIFRELMKDTAFDDYHSDSKVSSFFKVDNS